MIRSTNEHDHPSIRIISMCGIAGIIHASHETTEQAVCTMNRAQAHRGPDDEGAEVFSGSGGWVGFGHRRLAIIDVSTAGHQPMCDPDASNWITFNGEIYNFRELRRDLSRRGQIFRTKTDTEVVLKAYAVWGNACVQHLRGIFAFGIWDNCDSRLFLARDQLGVKPLYYWQQGGVMLFASEVRALLATNIVQRKMNIHGLRSFLAYGSVQNPLTLIDGVQSLLPGHTLTWKDGMIRTDRYWRLPDPESVRDKAPPDVFEQVLNVLEETIRLQMVSDVPLGVFLSGGIDSTAISALMQQASGDKIKTFSVVFDEKKYDERIYARTAAKHIGTQHTELLLRGEDVMRQMQKALAAYDQPSQDGLNTYFVSEVTREAGLTVAMSGVGGDELFGGYDGFRKFLIMERLGNCMRLMPQVLLNALAKMVQIFPFGEITRKFSDLLRNPDHSYTLSRQVFGPHQIKELLQPDIYAASEDWVPVTYKETAAGARGYDPINRVSALELQTYMLSTLLRDTDQMSMAHALEVRVPLIDHKLVELLFTLPGDIKIDKSQPKPLLTRTLGDRLPDICVHRKKQGFELPFNIWLRESMHSEMSQMLHGGTGTHHLPFVATGLSGLWQQFKLGQVSWSRIWGIYVLCDWLKRNDVVL